MKSLVYLAFVLLPIVATAQEPPESFCGFTFGDVYTGPAHVSLSRPFRYCNTADIRTTTNEQRIFVVSINGTTIESMSNEDAQVELCRICEIIESRFGIKMERLNGAARYDGKTFWIIAHIANIRNGKKSFSVEIARHDVLEADKNAAKKGALPLPPGEGIEAL